LAVFIGHADGSIRSAFITEGEQMTPMGTPVVQHRHFADPEQHCQDANDVLDDDALVSVIPIQGRMPPLMQI
jgi:hypothetical protein